MKNSILLFFISPFIGLVQAFKYYKADWAKNSVWLFIVFYGFTMFRTESMDSFRYVLKLRMLYDSPLNWDIFLANFYSDDGGSVDIYEPLITYSLSLITNNGNILFAVFGLVFGYFYSRNIWLIIGLSEGKEINKYGWYLIIAFCCVVGFWTLNGVRMFTAAHIFFYGAFLYLMNNEKKGFLIAASSVLVHFSFVLPVGLLILFITIRIPWRILYLFFIGSFFISSLNINSIKVRLESITPAFLLPRVNGYTSEEYVEVISDINNSANWYINYYSKSISWFIVIIFTYIYFYKKNINAYSKSFSNLFGFSLLFLTLGNITSLLPSGSRFLLIAQLFGMALVFLFSIEYGDKLFRRWLLLLTPLLLFFIIVSIRTSFDTLTIETIIMNPIFSAFVDFPVPLIDIFK